MMGWVSVAFSDSESSQELLAAEIQRNVDFSIDAVKIDRQPRMVVSDLRGMKAYPYVIVLIVIPKGYSDRYASVICPFCGRPASRVKVNFQHRKDPRDEIDNDDGCNKFVETLSDPTVVPFGCVNCHRTYAIGGYILVSLVDYGTPDPLMKFSAGGLEL